MPASTIRAFGFKSTSSSNGKSELNELGKPKKLYHGLGSDMGPIELEDGTVVDGGGLLMRDTWNADLPSDLKATYERGQHANPQHVWVHKNRMSGFWGASTPGTDFLESQGLRTLLFAGVNTGKMIW